MESQAGNEPVCAKQLLHLGSRAAVDQALSRLVGRRKIVRVARGFYALPVSTRFGDMAPGFERVIAAIARQKGERIAPFGAAAANAMGLTTQVPLRCAYLTSGRSRRLNLSGEKGEYLPYGNGMHERQFTDDWAVRNALASRRYIAPKAQLV